jgi:hypothetical protein
MNWAQLDGWVRAGLDGGSWSEVLDATCAALGARATALGVTQRPGRDGELYASAGADPNFLSTCHALLGAYGAEEVQERPYAKGRLLWAHAASDPRKRIQDVVVFAAWAHAGDRAALAQVAAIAAGAVAARRRMEMMRDSIAALRRAAFDDLAFGVVIVDKVLRVAEANKACQDIFARGDGLTLYQDRLMCRSASDGVKLAALVAASLSGARDNQTTEVSRAGGADPYLVHPVAVRDSNADAKHCLLRIIDPESQSIAAALLRAHVNDVEAALAFNPYTPLGKC